MKGFLQISNNIGSAPLISISSVINKISIRIIYLITTCNRHVIIHIIVQFAINFGILSSKLHNTHIKIYYLIANRCNLFAIHSNKNSFKSLKSPTAACYSIHDNSLTYILSQVCFYILAIINPFINICNPNSVRMSVQ